MFTYEVPQAQESAVANAAEYFTLRAVQLSSRQTNDYEFRAAIVTAYVDACVRLITRTP
jgi:hypothetical protein